MTTLSRRGLLKLAEKNQIPAVLRYNWQLRCGFDPIVAAYETGIYVRQGAYALLVWTALLVLIVLSPNFLSVGTSMPRLIGLVMAIAAFVFWIHYWKEVDEKRWNHTYRVTDFPDDLKGFIDEHGWYIGDLMTLSPGQFEPAVRKNLVAQAKKVTELERLYEKQTGEDKFNFPISQISEASNRFKRLFQISAKFSLTDKNGHGSYFSEAEKLLGPVKSGVELRA